jgi:hypothetical protein
VSAINGTAASAHATTMAAAVRPLSELGWSYAKRAGAQEALLYECLLLLFVGTRQFFDEMGSYFQVGYFSIVNRNKCV